MNTILQQSMNHLNNFKFYSNEINELLKSSKSFVSENYVKIGLASVLGYSVYYVANMWHSYGTFKRMGFRTPPFKFFYGHQLEIREKVN